MSNIKKSEKIRSILIGEWQLSRNISGNIYPMELLGRASFKNCGDYLFYREEFKVPTPIGEILNGTREYQYYFNNDQLAIYFSSMGVRGGLFLSLKLSTNNGINGTKGSGVHHCGSDRYDAEFNFLTYDNFKITYKVSGPKKDYTMITKYKREAGY
ncbi:MAG TPA: DUF6314 family protein [Oligoflexia bacterium]|nr:DUF6314 family protein [Oligoflexia bacterium]HMP27694.1 DUF6314 family protein [Oligoflexia bacterium]